MTQIPTPDWAHSPEVRFHHMRLSDYMAILAHRKAMLAVVHQEVEAYLNTAGLYCESAEEGFPDRSRMTGEYYIESEFYETHVGPVWFQIGVMCHCLEKPWYEGQIERDYLGLEVWIRCDPENWAFTIFRNTDSSSI